MAYVGLSLADETWKSFSDGGELQWLKDPGLLTILAGTYARIGYVRSLSEKYFDLVAVRKTFKSVAIRSLENNLKKDIYDLHENIFQTVNYIESIAAAEKWPERTGSLRAYVVDILKFLYRRNRRRRKPMLNEPRARKLEF